jgi:hypothetical protein
LSASSPDQLTVVAGTDAAASEGAMNARRSSWWTSALTQSYDFGSTIGTPLMMSARNMTGRPPSA